MKIEPNTDIGMKAVNILVNENRIELLDGSVISSEDIDKGENAFSQLCASIDANLTYINVIVPNRSDDELYFKVRDIGQKLNVHVQSVAYKEHEAWDIWNSHKNLNQESNI